MKKWRILSLDETEIFLHPALLIYMIYAVLTDHGMFMIVSLISIALHECAHAACACLFGKPPRSIELTPLGAMMRMEDECSLPPLKRAIMLLAGPGLTLALCLGALALTRHHVLPITVGRMMFLANTSILLLNMLPALPLDGGRVLALLLSNVFSHLIVHRIMRWIGSLLGIGMIALNIYASWKMSSWNLSLSFAGCCLLYSSSASLTTRAMAELRDFVDRKIRLERKGSISVTWICALKDVPLRKLIRKLPHDRMAIYLCVEPGILKLRGQLTEAELIQQYLSRPELSLGEALNLYPSRENAPKYDTI